MRLVTDIFEFCAKELPRWNTISISGYHMREAGATAAQELAFTLADGIAYVDAARARGLDIDAFAGRSELLLRRVERPVRGSGQVPRGASHVGADHARPLRRTRARGSMMCRFHVQTAGSSLTAQSVDNNVVRTTIEALAAVLGGAQSLHTNARDEALALPTEAAARLALRTQQIIAHESGVIATPGPARGKLLRRAAHRPARRGRERLPDQIDAMGGALAAIEARLPAARDPGGRVSDSAGSRGGRPGRRRRQSDSATTRSTRPSFSGSTRPANESRSSAFATPTCERDAGEWQAAMDRLRGAANGTDNLLPLHRRCGQGQGDAGRSQRRVARGLWRASGAAHRLMTRATAALWLVLVVAALGGCAVFAGPPGGTAAPVATSRSVAAPSGTSVAPSAAPIRTSWPLRESTRRPGGNGDAGPGQRPPGRRA